jgi:hypothetical protein
MKKIFIDKRITKSGKKSFLNVNTTLDLYKYITAVHNDNQIVEDTYSALVNKINTSSLIPGAYYIITEFRTRYNRPDYDQSKSPIFDSLGTYFEGPIEPIIVLATSSNTLAVDAYQPAYPNDKIKYDITYSTTESGDEAFGRITERIDEWNNRTDYDHRNIEFKRYVFYYFSKETPETGTMELLNDGTVNGSGTFFTNYSPGQVIAYPNSSEGFFKIDTITSDTLMSVTGLSINPGMGSDIFYIANLGSYDNYYQNNVRDPNDFNLYTTFGDAIGDGVINNYIGNYSNLHIEDGQGDFLLANNVFKDGEYNNNTIGNGFYNNTFNDDCNNNKIGNYCYNNVTNNDFDGNVIGNFFTNNLITADFRYNQIGEFFENNVILNNDFEDNQIGNNFNNNWFDGNYGFVFINNRIGESFSYNTFFRDFNDNTVINDFSDNEIYQNCYNNNISNFFNNNTIGDVTNIGAGAFEDNIISNDFKGNVTIGAFTYNQIGNNFYSNQTGDSFTYNVIGNNTFSNNISANFAYNKIGNSFQNNIVANNFGFGGGVPKGNVIGNDFNSNNIGEYFYDNIISDNFSSNIIGDDFTNNRVSKGFNNNTIGFEFQNNDIKVSVSGNDFRTEQGQLATVTNINTPNGVDNTYTNIPASGTSGVGQNGTFDIDVLGGIVNTVTINNIGYGYVNGDTIIIKGSQFGGISGLDDLTLSVDSATTTTYVTDPTSCTIFNDSTFSTQLMYIDGTGTLNVVNVTSQS